jgi:M6 family metalloprotease-like protein
VANSAKPRRIVGCLCACMSLGLVLAASTASAYPHRGQHVMLTQPDGSVADVVVWGDEFYVRAESPDGYALAHNPVTGFIDYAAATGDGELVASGVAYRGPLPSYSAGGTVTLAQTLDALGIDKGLRRSRARVAEIVAENRARTTSLVAPTRTDGVGQRTLTVPKTYPYRVAPTGVVTGLVVVVDFSDRMADIDKSEIESAFNGASYGSSWHGSIRNWSEIISDGATSVQHNVLGYYRAANPTSYYNRGEEWDYGTSDELYREVYQYIDENLELSSFAVNGELPSLALAYTGEIIAPVWASGLWPHGGCTDWGYQTSEGVMISRCYMTNLGSRTPLELGTHRHELGHSFFDWPDTYDYDDDSKSGGGFATEEDWPCAPFRMWAGWTDTIDVTNAPGIYQLTANGDTCLRYDNSSSELEYFVAEYMKREGYRTSSPDDGLLVWHIEEGGDNSFQDMTEQRHYLLSVEQADGKYDLEHNVDGGSGDLFHAGDKERFDETTTPNTNWWNGRASGLKICDISGIDGDTMTLNVGCAAVGGTSGTGGTGSGGSGSGGVSNGGASAGGVGSAGATSAGGAGSGGRTIGEGGAGEGGDRDLGAGGTVLANGGSGVGGVTTVASGGSGIGGAGVGGAGVGGAGVGGAGVGGAGLGGTLGVGGRTPATGGAGVGGATVVAAGGTGVGGANAAGVGGPAVMASGGRTTAVGGAVATVGGRVGTAGAAAGASPISEDETSVGDSGGCGCRAAGQSRVPIAGALVGLLGSLLLRLRRRRASNHGRRDDE